MNLVSKKSRFYIIPDTHFWDKNLANRNDYLEECANIYDFLLKMLSSPNDNIEKIYIIFLGDIFHNKFTKDTNYNAWIQNLLILRSKCNGIFSVVGNHELTYAAHNPFWGLLNEIESTVVKNLGCSAMGKLQIIRIPDYLDIFNYRLNFNHYGSGIANVKDSHNILLCHNYWMSSEIINSLKITGEFQTNLNYLKYNTIQDGCALQYFEEAFFGHNHMLIGDYNFKWANENFKETNAHFCGSLGLTTKNEVKFTPDTRKIYYLDILGNDKMTINSLTYSLPKFDKEVLNLVEVSESEDKYKAAKYKKSLIKKYNLVMMDPIQAIQEDLASDALALEAFNELGKGGVPVWVQKLI